MIEGVFEFTSSASYTEVHFEDEEDIREGLKALEDKADTETLDNYFLGRGIRNGKLTDIILRRNKPPQRADI